MSSICKLNEPDLIIISHASRKYATAIIYVKELDIGIDKLELRSEIYGGNRGQLFCVPKVLPTSANDVWMFARNTGLNGLTSYLLVKPIANIITSANLIA